MTTVRKVGPFWEYVLNGRVSPGTFQTKAEATEALNRAKG